MPPAARFPWTAAHFVGVGGISMSGLACALAGLGVPCSGSDVVASARTQRAAAAGVGVCIGHDRRHVAALPAGAVVVHNTDVPAANPELQEARARGLAVEHRSAVLAWFLRAAGPRAAAVTGTHGKSTTSSLLALAARAGGLDPTVFVGADVPGLEGGNYRLGSGPVIAEADESDGSFLRYRPDVTVITALEPEHLEHYGGDFAAVVAAFRRYLGQLPPGAVAVLNADDGRLAGLRDAVPARAVWYGLGPDAELTAADLRLDPERTRFTAVLRGEVLCAAALRLPGRHNVSNALGALGAALALGVDPAPAAAAFAEFEGPVRRFQVLTTAGGITVVDDYAHNPAKVSAALAGARQRARGRVLAVFQPHRYNRTVQLWDVFGPAFRGCDAVWITDVYAPAGEERVSGVSGRAFADLVRSRSAVPVRFSPNGGAVVDECLGEARPGDLVIVMGAGDITLVAHALAARVEERARGAAAGPS
jgi:UDP-N-acetylmuramate--alanine ligase